MNDQALPDRVLFAFRTDACAVEKISPRRSLHRSGDPGLQASFCCALSVGASQGELVEAQSVNSGTATGLGAGARRNVAKPVAAVNAAHSLARSERMPQTAHVSPRFTITLASSPKRLL